MGVERVIGNKYGYNSELDSDVQFSTFYILVGMELLILIFEVMFNRESGNELESLEWKSMKTLADSLSRRKRRGSLKSLSILARVDVIH